MIILFPKGTVVARVLKSLALLAALAMAGAGPAAEAAQIQRLYHSNKTDGKSSLPKFGQSSAASVEFASKEAPGTLVVDVDQRALYLVEGGGKALRYTISVGRDGFGWSGTVVVRAKKEWPDWRPPAEMRQRQPELPELVPAGPYNPLGARALYLYRGGQDTLYRIHGTNDADGVGANDTSGCFRLTNTDIMDLYRRVPIGTKVVVR